MAQEREELVAHTTLNAFKAYFDLLFACSLNSMFIFHFKIQSLFTDHQVKFKLLNQLFLNNVFTMLQYERAGGMVMNKTTPTCFAKYIIMTNMKMYGNGIET